MKTTECSAHPIAPARTHRHTQPGAKLNLVLVHGVYHGSWAFKHLYPRLLALGCSVSRVDLRGHYGPDRVKDSDVGFADYLADLGAQLDALSGDKVVVGHSLGGLLALWLAERPDVKGLVLLAVPLPEVVKSKRWGLLLRHPIKSLKMVLERDPAIFYHDRHWVNHYFFDPDLPEPEAWAAYTEICRQDEPFKLFDDINGLSSRRLLVSIPSLVIYGTRDPTVDAAAAKKLAHKLGQRPLSIEGAGHDLMLNPSHVKQLNGLIGEWLQKQGLVTDQG